MGSPAATAAKPVNVTHQIVSISVDLGVTTPDNLRHIGFGLEKDTADDGSITWTINFKFQERAKTTAAFNDVVTLTVKVKTKNTPLAEATAKEGLSPAQVDHLNGPVTIAVKQAQTDPAVKAQLLRLVEGTLAKHNA